MGVQKLRWSSLPVLIHFCIKKHVRWKWWLPAVWAFNTDFRTFAGSRSVVA